MGSAQQSMPRPAQVIVHHLSDLNYQENTENPDNRLLTYQRYLLGLPPDRYPDVIVITGNLTASGTEKQLAAVKDMLLAGFSRWDGRLHEHIFIVPGPQDINWQWQNVTKAGLAPFYEIFKPFATPYHTPMPTGRPSAGVASGNWAGYPIDTCYAPTELDAELKKHYKQYSHDFGKFVKRRGRAGARFLGMWKRPGRPTRNARVEARRLALERLQAEFLSFTESTRPLDMRVGRVSAEEITRFQTWVQSQAASAQAATAQVVSAQAASGSPPPPPPPLQLLITHHPVIIRANEASGDPDSTIEKRLYKPLLDAARGAGVQLALHGHNHNGDMVFDESTFEATTTVKRMRQLGAASLAKTGVFNEITAIFREEPGQSPTQSPRLGEWELTFLPISLSAAGPVAARGAPGNLAAMADRQIRRLNRAVTQRSDFERMLRYAMRRFSEQVYQVRQEKLPGSSQQQITSLPPEPLLLIRDVISKVIFKGFETRVRILLKNVDSAGGPVPRLVPTYLAPAIIEGPEVLVYPASVAAWSLALGRTLIYPAILTDVTTPGDHEWLRRSGKIKTLMPLLQELREEASRTNADDEVKRYETLYTNLDAIKVGTAGASNVGILGSNLYQKGPEGGPASTYSTFACVPYPLRPAGGALPTLPEIAVLDIAVGTLELPDPEDTSPIPIGPFLPFTQERVEMLEAVVDFIGMMLTSADALGRPPGVWNERRW